MNKKLIYLRTFSLFCVFMAVPVALTMATYGQENYFNFSGPYNPEIANFTNQLKYFTIWSNILAMFWVVLAFIASMFNIEKLKNFVEHPTVKLTPFIMMFITMTVSFIILYPVAYVGYLKEESWQEALKWILLVAFATPLLFQHFLVSIVLIIDLAITKGYRTKNNEKETMKDTSISLSLSILIPLAWLVLSIILIELGKIDPQYPFMKIFLPASEFNLNTVQIIVDVITLLSIFVTWFAIWFFIRWITNRKYLVKT